MSATIPAYEHLANTPTQGSVAEMPVEISNRRGTVIAAGGVAAVLGLYWDDAWHTDVGRDAFLSPPHLLLYAGVSVLLAAAAWWAWRRYQAVGRAALRDPTVLLPLLGAAVTLAAAPVDELWHQLFGRDAVTWSPPHMVAVAGMAAFAAGLYLVATRPGARPVPLAGTAIGAFLIAAVCTVVMEFETDVPQFPVVWYLPVKVAVLTFAFGLIRTASSRPWAATRAAAAYVALRVGVVAFLAALGHSLPTVMPTVMAAWGLEVALRRGWGRWPAALATTVATVGSHALAHRLQPAGLGLTAADVAVGVAAGVVLAAGALAALGLAGGGRAPRPDGPAGAARPAAAVRQAAAARLVAAALLVPLAVVAPAGAAFAHDPGQGDEVAPVVLDAVRDGDLIEVRVSAPDGGCRGWRPVRVVARRAGRAPDGPLTRVEGCRFAGAVEVDDPGRWFVYTELAVEGRVAEAWLPVEEGSHGKATALYVAAGDGPHASQVVAGAVLYLVVALLFTAIVVAYRRAARQSASDRWGLDAAERVPVGAR